MERAAIIKSLQEWQEFYRQQRETLYPRHTEIALPDRHTALGLIGIRRAGKTTIAIQTSRLVDSASVFYYNFEDPLFSNQAGPEALDLLLECAQEYSTDRIELLILDEIHNVPFWEKWLRKLIDLKQYRIIVTGSSAKLIRSELATALTGRTITKEIWPLSVKEYSEFSARVGRKMATPKLLRNYLNFGGFPAVTLQGEDSQKIELLRSYFSDILLKDVVLRNHVRNVAALKNLATFIITNLSSLHSSVSIKRALDIEKDTALSYLGYLADSFLINPCELFTNNLKVQHRAPTKYYLSDLGLRLVGAKSATSDDGKLLENLVYLELRRQTNAIYYYKGKGEVDFLITDSYKPESAFQVAFSMADKTTKEREIGALLELSKQYEVQNLFVITWNEEDTIKSEGKKIKVVPLKKFCNL